MARFISKNKGLYRKYYWFSMIHSFVSAIMCVSVLGFFLTIAANVFLDDIRGTVKIGQALVIVIVAASCLRALTSRKVETLKAGYDGESTTARIIDSLPDSYVGIQNLKVIYDGKTSELDMVVVGPTGVFVIETKNLKGSIVGGYDSYQWVQRKITSKGNLRTENFYSPIKQVGTHVYRLANFLRSNGIHAHVKDVVFFSNPDTVVELVGEPVATPVFSLLDSGTTRLYKYIRSGVPLLSDEQVQRIVSMLVK